MSNNQPYIQCESRELSVLQALSSTSPSHVSSQSFISWNKTIISRHGLVQVLNLKELQKPKQLDFVK